MESLARLSDSYPREIIEDQERMQIPPRQEPSFYKVPVYTQPRMDNVITELKLMNQKNAYDTDGKLKSVESELAKLKDAITAVIQHHTSSAVNNPATAKKGMLGGLSDVCNTFWSDPSNAILIKVLVIVAIIVLCIVAFAIIFAMVTGLANLLRR
jgi:hypothetical protein